MKKTMTILALFCCSATVLYAQSRAPIEIRKRKFYQEDHRLKRAEVRTLMESNPVATEYIDTAESNMTLGIFTVTIGAALAGGALVHYVFFKNEYDSNTPRWGLIATGGVLCAISIPSFIFSKSNTRKAVEAYNRGLNVGSLRPKTSLSLAYTGNGVGLVYAF